jgi:hypothetical protein
VPGTVSRRKFLQLGAAGLAALGTAHAFLVEPQHLVTKRVALRLKRLPEAFHGIRIAQLSDIHYGPFVGSAYLAKALELATSFQPALLVLTGDFVSHPLNRRNGPEGARHAEPCAQVLSQARSVLQVAVLGNHDHWNGAEIVADALRSSGIRLLRNQAFPVEREGGRIWIAGVDDVMENQADLAATLQAVPASEATILLAHEPDFADEAARFPVDLQLSGHSHGGQVRIPGLGPIVLPALARKYHTGVNRVRELQVYTSHGIGVINPPVRLFCPPEVTLLTLYRERS